MVQVMILPPPHRSMCPARSKRKRLPVGWLMEWDCPNSKKTLDAEFGIVMTYMDVRFLVDDLDLSLVDLEEPTPEKDEADSVEDSVAELDDMESTGGVQVEVDTVVPPGAMASGSVVFSDGISKSWTIDQFGRLGMSGGQEGYKPSDEDLMEFQRQLEASLRGKGI